MYHTAMFFIALKCIRVYHTHMTATKPAKKTVQVVVSGMPPELLATIDAMAAKEDRSRAVYIRRLLAEIIATKKARSEKPTRVKKAALPIA